MTVERTIYCDGPDCFQMPEGPPATTITDMPEPYVPPGWLYVSESCEGGILAEVHFCGWTCCMKYAADQPEEEDVYVEITMWDSNGNEITDDEDYEDDE